MRGHFYPVIIAAVLLVVSCGDAQTSSTSDAPSAGAPQVSEKTASETASTPAVGNSLAGRTGELDNPEASTMVFLYYDLAGIKPPIDSWVENDSRVQYAPGIDKASRRTAVRAELESGAAAVHGIGVIRLSLNSANLSDYDPAYGEFTVRALAPSSEIPFDALGQKIAIKFGNSRAAQIWRVPAAEAQAIRDKINGSNVSLDMMLKITGVQPTPGGGTITADVVEYEMRETRGGNMIARVQVAKQ